LLVWGFHLTAQNISRLNNQNRNTSAGLLEVTINNQKNEKITFSLSCFNSINSNHINGGAKTLLKNDER